MAITFRILLAVALILAFNINNTMAEEINSSESELQEFNPDNNVNLLPDSYEFYLDQYINQEVNMRLESSKSLKEEERIFTRKEWNSLEKQVMGLADATNTILPEDLSDQLQEQLGFIEQKAGFIGDINTVINGDEAKICVLQELAEITKFCEEMMDEVIKLESSSEWNPWWKEAFELKQTLEDFLEKTKNMLCNVD